MYFAATPKRTKASRYKAVSIETPAQASIWALGAPTLTLAMATKPVSNLIFTADTPVKSMRFPTTSVLFITSTLEPIAHSIMTSGKCTDQSAMTLA